MTAAQVRSLITVARLSLDSWLTGKAIYVDVENLGVASNIAMLLCEAGIGRELIDTVKRAQAVIVAAMTERMARERVVVLAPGASPVRDRADYPALTDQADINALVEMLDLHDQQVALPEFSAGVMTEVLVELTHRVENGDVYKVTA